MVGGWWRVGVLIQMSSLKGRPEPRMGPLAPPAHTLKIDNILTERASDISGTYLPRIVVNNNCHKLQGASFRDQRSSL